MEVKSPDTRRSSSHKNGQLHSQCPFSDFCVRFFRAVVSTGWHRQKFIVLHFWRPGVQDQVAGRLVPSEDYEGHCSRSLPASADFGAIFDVLGLQMQPSNLCLHLCMAFSL
jgi:hypothetical protein